MQTHNTLARIKVHIWQRSGKYLARGRLEGRLFGENLGDNAVLASARLREILTRIDNGTYTRPSDGKGQVMTRNRIARPTLRDLVADFLAEKRRSRGRQTANDYSVRLAPALDFAEITNNLKRWPHALDIDTEFVGSFRAFLFQYRSTRNGRIGGNTRTISSRQIINILECLRTMLHWASSAKVRKLPAEWEMPLTRDLIGAPPAKNPLRDDKLPLDVSVQLVNAMDLWQLCHLTLSMVLPLRPDEAAGLLISDVNFEKRWLEFGARMKGTNFTKGRTAFMLPFPSELDLILRECIGNRAEGPLLRRRAVFGGKKAVETVTSINHLVQLFDAELLRQPVDAVQAEQDRKLLFRSLLRTLGGTTEDAMNREFKKLLPGVGITNGATLYTLRSSVTTAMHRANLPHLEMRYLTGHSASDILNEYTSLDPVGPMKCYFETIQPLLVAVNEHARELGISDTGSPSRAMSSVEEQELLIEPPKAGIDSTVLGMNSEISVEQKSTGNEQQCESTSPQTGVSTIVMKSAEAIAASMPSKGTARSCPQDEDISWWHKPHELPAPNEFFTIRTLQGSQKALSMCFRNEGSPDYRRVEIRAKGNKALWVIKHSAHNWEIYFKSEEMYENHRKRFDEWKAKNKDKKQHK